MVLALVFGKKEEKRKKKNMTENFNLKALVGLSDVISYNWAKIIR